MRNAAEVQMTRQLAKVKEHFPDLDVLQKDDLLERHQEVFDELMYLLLMDRQGIAKRECLITNVMDFANSQVAVFDNHGEQVPELQGSWLLQLLVRAEKLGMTIAKTLKWNDRMVSVIRDERNKIINYSIKQS
jgi:hypothetical protein